MSVSYRFWVATFFFLSRAGLGFRDIECRFFSHTARFKRLIGFVRPRPIPLDSLLGLIAYFHKLAHYSAPTLHRIMRWGKFATATLTLIGLRCIVQPVSLRHACDCT